MNQQLDPIVIVSAARTPWVVFSATDPRRRRTGRRRHPLDPERAGLAAEAVDTVLINGHVAYADEQFAEELGKTRGFGQFLRAG